MSENTVYKKHLIIYTLIEMHILNKTSDKEVGTPFQFIHLANPNFIFGKMNYVHVACQLLF